MIVTVASLVLMNVQVMCSPASRPIVATLPAVLVSSPPPSQTRLVGDQPAPARRASVLAPCCAAGNVKVRELGSVPSASSSSEKLLKPAGPPPAPVKAKSWESSGAASLTIVIVASLVFVIGRASCTQASKPMVATLPAVLGLPATYV